MAKCRYLTCIRVAGPGDHEDCPPCRARYKYWDKKTVYQRLERRRKLDLSGETMREFVGDSALRARVRKEYAKEKKRAET